MSRCGGVRLHGSGCEVGGSIYRTVRFMISMRRYMIGEDGVRWGSWWAELLGRAEGAREEVGGSRCEVNDPDPALGFEKKAQGGELVVRVT